MATINYLYHSTKNQAPFGTTLLFNLNKKPFVFGVKTIIEVTKQLFLSYIGKSNKDFAKEIFN